MVKAEVNGNKYEIRWSYKFSMTKPDKEGKARRRKNRPPHSTVCSLYAGEHMIDEATIRLHRDNGIPANYEKARKFALRKLLSQSADGPQNREFRTQIWSAYHNRPRPKNKEKITVPGVSQELIAK